MVIALAYLVVIVVYSKTFEERSCHLNLLFKRCKPKHFTTEPVKPTVCKSEYLYLGLVVSAEGVKLGPVKAAPMLRLPVLATAKLFDNFWVHKVITDILQRIMHVVSNLFRILLCRMLHLKFMREMNRDLLLKYSLCYW